MGTADARTWVTEHRESRPEGGLETAIMKQPGHTPPGSGQTQPQEGGGHRPRRRQLWAGLRCGLDPTLPLEARWPCAEPQRPPL